MGEGFEMITKIKQEKITEIIQKLEIFKQNIVQFLDKDTINALESQKYSSLMISRINEEKNEDILKSQIMEEEAKSLLKQNISQIDSLNVNQNSGYTSFDNNNVSQSLQQDSLFNQAKRRYGRITSISGGNNLIENYNMKAYYVSDTGLRNIILGFRNINEGHLLENIVYLELLRRGYKVSIGKTLDYEVDFVAENTHTIKYYQVTQTLSDEQVKNRELRSLESISDNYEKIILSMDKSINNDYNGIKVKNIINWLLENEE